MVKIRARKQQNTREFHNKMGELETQRDELVKKTTSLKEKQSEILATVRDELSRFWKKTVDEETVLQTMQVSKTVF